MATVLPRERVDRLLKDKSLLTRAAQRAARIQLESIAAQPIDAFRDEAIEAVDAICAEAAEQAAAVESVFYSDVSELATGSAPESSVVESGYVPGRVESSMRAFLKELLDGDADSFMTLVMERISKEINDAMAHCASRNMIRDRRSTKLFARVPSGNETCPFCIMLASRGFVYRSAESAGGHYHPFCDCVVVQGYPGMQVEGYDTDALLNRYYESLADGSLKKEWILHSQQKHNTSYGVSAKGSIPKERTLESLKDFLKGASSIEELENRATDVMGYLNSVSKAEKSAKFPTLSRVAQERMGELKGE